MNVLLSVGVQRFLYVLSYTHIQIQTFVDIKFSNINKPVINSQH